ncbi:MAG: Glutamine cyclotransferase [uncultured Pyrinomonadaceae bacterium]|uniref:Glutamine cyclotransferase n=1 Tax=uncultured Pyrinomonadaceae bacterium TaxID=2283094 RepID=A0A6J4P1N9_9BACT|nr:MAG: Glutamine cyclotransferase [uncultured Pyrinomonadaceae bacterium]
MRFFLLITFAVFAASCKNNTSANRPNVNNNSAANANKTVAAPAPAADKIPVYTYEIVNTFKHDPKAFTQGLVYENGFLYESTGQTGESTLRKVELESGKVLQKHDVDDDIFAEGMTILNGKIYQITWQDGVCFVYDLKNFKLLEELKYNGEGWGLTNDGTNLIMSDGTHIIKFLDPQTLKTVRALPVFQETGKPLFKINELEYVKGEIWANIWHSEEIGKPNHIARIDPNSGKLLGWINLQGISPDDVARDEENTLNGIAYDAGGDRIFVTGKNWKNLFEIKIKPKS